MAIAPFAVPLVVAGSWGQRRKAARRRQWQSCGWQTVEAWQSVETPARDIVDTAMAAGSFSTLLQAILAAELDSVLKGEGPFTVFAPTDEAFEKLGAKTLRDLLDPENRDKLREILTYHVVPDRLTSSYLTSRSSVVRSRSVETVDGRELDVSVAGGKVKVGDAEVVQADIACSNGIIHVIDTVLQPADK